MRVGIDWVSLAIFVVAFAISQTRMLSVAMRFGVMAVACGAIAAYRLTMGLHGLNMAFVLVAAGLATYYLVKAMRARER